MDILLSTALIKYEIAFLFLNLAYLAFHYLHTLVTYYLRLRAFLGPHKIEHPQDINVTGTVTEPVVAAVKEDMKSEETVLQNLLSSDEKQYLIELVKLIKTKIARGEFQDAKGKIIEGLSIDKFNKDLNLLLASLYEKEQDYKKAELIYKDLIMLHDADAEIYLKLGFALSIQGKYEIAYEIYKRLLTLDESSMETIEMLANLAHQLKHREESNEYARTFLKKHPHNIDMLYLVAVNSIDLGLRNDALEALKKIRTFEPYNTKINELIKKLELELELEKNFQSGER